MVNTSMNGMISMRVLLGMLINVAMIVAVARVQMMASANFIRGIRKEVSIQGSWLKILCILGMTTILDLMASCFRSDAFRKRRICFIISGLMAF